MVRTLVLSAFVAAGTFADESLPTEGDAACLHFTARVEMFNLYTH